MAKKKKFTVRVAYTVYDYYDVEATSEERAIEKAMEQPSEDSLNDFIIQGEGIVTQINGKPVEPKKREPEKVMVLYEVDEEDNTKTSIVAMTEADWQKRKPEAIEKGLREHFDERYAGCDDDYFCYEDEIKQAVEALSAGYETEFDGNYMFWDSVELVSLDNPTYLLPYGDGEGIVTQINGKPVEPKKPDPEKLMVLCSYDSDEQEFDDHLIVSKKVFYSMDGKKKIRKYLNEAFEYKNMDDDDREEFRECVKNLLKGGVGYFGIKYFWEETTAIL